MSQCDFPCHWHRQSDELELLITVVTHEEVSAAGGRGKPSTSLVEHVNPPVTRIIVDLGFCVVRIICNVIVSYARSRARRGQTKPRLLLVSVPSSTLHSEDKIKWSRTWALGYSQSKLCRRCRVCLGALEICTEQHHSLLGHVSIMIPRLALTVPCLQWPPVRWLTLVCPHHALATRHIARSPLVDGEQGTAIWPRIPGTMTEYTHGSF
ncbi:hypothetical protein V8C37DRAFT_114346 [Trichoderma ceciliae]